MKDNRTTDTNEEVTANAAEAAENREVAAGLKKFKNVQALIDAYQALEAEFTRRSQRLKELEENEANKGSETPASAASVNSPSQRAADDIAFGADTLPGEVKNAVIAEYLNGVYANRGVPLITGGGAVATARRSPSTLREAGILARNYLDSKEDK